MDASRAPRTGRTRLAAPILVLRSHPVLGIALSFPLALLAAPQAAATPPGLVVVKGGKTKFGSTEQEIEPLVLAHEELRHVLAAQTPQFTDDVEDFFLMPTEVTNEQYAEFVKATGAKPPRSWGQKALLAGQAAFADEIGKARQEAKAAGKPFEAKKFDPEKWWDDNWKDAEWEIPQAELAHPVVFISYAEAQRYSRWAGLRLMSEFEYQRAARADTARAYPWGDAWDDKKYCQSLHIGKDLAARVGTFPEGAANGIFDLSGNVWEWTASPFTAYPGHKTLKFKAKKREIECLAPFDPNQRVIVSGSYQMDKIGVRVATRMNTDRSQSTSALGFRCAASTVPGQDAARWIIDQDLNLSVLGNEAELAPSLTATMRRWTSVPGTAGVQGYAVITGYEHVLACPRSELRAASPSELATITTKDGPLQIGILEVPLPMKGPELDAGVFFIAWRGAGKLPEVKVEKDKQGIAVQGQESGQHPLLEVPGFTPEKDCYLFYSADGTPQVALEAPPVLSEKMRASEIKVEPFVPPDPKTLPKDAPPPTPIDTLRVTLVVQSASSKSKGFVFDLPIKVAPDAYKGW
jgi:formylglycine-generating enzyme required for sulfatase activity